MNFFSIFLSGDLVLSLVFVALFVMSILSWYVIFYKSLKLKKEYRAYKNFCKNQTSKRDWALNFQNHISQLILPNDKNLLPKNSLNFLLQEVIDLQPILKKYSNPIARKDILTMHLIQALDEIRFGLDHGLTILASIGSCAPFVGLFGTVWGIYHALGNIAKQGSVGLNVVSGPISEALVATAFGLFAAIPAVLAYNSIVRLNRLLVQNLRHLAERITAYEDFKSN
jgi:biopolymer transport protein ExbB